jgi:hypothetical protein
MVAGGDGAAGAALGAHEVVDAAVGDEAAHDAVVVTAVEMQGLALAERHPWDDFHSGNKRVVLGHRRSREAAWLRPGWPGAHCVALHAREKDDGSVDLRVPAGPGGRRPYRVTGFWLPALTDRREPGLLFLPNSATIAASTTPRIAGSPEVSAV